MAYDSDRQVNVVYGGYDPATYEYVTQTWEWNGQDWALVGTSGPDASGHEMVYDSIRGVVVLFLGTSSGQTWEWDGAMWTLRTTTGPPPRLYYAMTFDSARGVTVMHGGQTWTPRVTFSDTWEWDGTSWSLRTAGGPVRRSHVLAYDSARGVTVLFGGRNADESSVIRELWHWDGTAWVLVVSGTGPYAENMAMVYDDARDLMVLFYNEYPNGWYAWEWDGSQWSSRTVLGPNAIRIPLTYDSSRQRIVYFSGIDLWEWDTADWSMRWGGAPYVPVFAFDTVRGVTLAVSACCGDHETWAYDGDRWALLTRTGPSRRENFALTFDEQRGVAVLYGGGTYHSGWTLFDETWEWDGIAWTQRFVAGPSPRYLHGMAYDRARSVTVLFSGGRDSGVGVWQVGGTWEWDGIAWTDRGFGGPTIRYGHAMTYHEALGVSLVYGGIFRADNDAPVYLDDTWSWDGTQWTQLGDDLFYADDLTMAYDSRRGAAVLTDSGSLTWEFRTWQETPNPPLAETWPRANVPPSRIGTCPSCPRPSPTALRALPCGFRLRPCPARLIVPASPTLVRDSRRPCGSARKSFPAASEPRYSGFKTPRCFVIGPRRRRE